MKKLMLKLDFKEQNVVEVWEGEHLMHALVFECIQLKALLSMCYNFMLRFYMMFYVKYFFIEIHFGNESMKSITPYNKQ